MTGLWLSLWLAVASATGPIELVVGGVTISAEVADDAAERRVGLMGRQSLPKNHGMLFVYPDQAVRSFWMKNTPLPLSIAFIDKLGRVVHMAELTPNETTSVTSQVPAMYALEMTTGWFEAHGVTIGQPISGLPVPVR